MTWKAAAIVALLASNPVGAQDAMRREPKSVVNTAGISKPSVSVDPYPLSPREVAEFRDSGAVVSPAPVHVPLSLAQWSATNQRHGSMSGFAGADKSPSGKRHVLIGAGIGAAAGTILGLVAVSQDKSGYFSSWHFVALPVLAGAGTGALVG